MTQKAKTKVISFAILLDQEENLLSMLGEFCKLKGYFQNEKRNGQSWRARNNFEASSR